MRLSGKNRWSETTHAWSWSGRLPRCSKLVDLRALRCRTFVGRTVAPPPRSYVDPYLIERQKPLRPPQGFDLPYKLCPSIIACILRAGGAGSPSRIVCVGQAVLCSCAAYHSLHHQPVGSRLGSFLTFAPTSSPFGSHQMPVIFTVRRRK